MVPVAMFESLCIRRSDKLDIERPLDLGLLVEALVFYGEVHLIADRAILNQLVRQEPDVALELVESGFIHMSYLENLTAVHTETVGNGAERHRPCVVGTPDSSLHRWAPQAFIAATGKDGRGRRLARRFMNQVE